MNCNIIKDLLPLYIDGCCSEESEKVVEEHIKDCGECQKLFEEMKAPSDMVVTTKAPETFSKLNDWKASILQSVLLFLSFGVITIGVALEANTPFGLLNGYWAFNLVVPATGFMLSLVNWYFVRVYKNRKTFSNFSLLATMTITFIAFVWTLSHYHIDLLELFRGRGFVAFFEVSSSLFLLDGIGICMTIMFCCLSKCLSNLYAKMLGKK